MTLPKTPDTPEVELEWKIPQWSNAIERDRARIYFVAYAGGHGAALPRQGVRGGPRRPHEDVRELRRARRRDRLRLPRGGARRALAPHGHPRRQDRQLPPVPADAVERLADRLLRHARAPYEDACNGMPIFEEADADSFRGIDIMRAVRSFDPCLPCGVHMYLGNGRRSSRCTRRCSGEHG
jgi:hydrogenase large subunit